MASDNITQSQQMLKEDEDSNALPPMISVNLREKLNAEQVTIEFSVLCLVLNTSSSLVLRFSLFRIIGTSTVFYHIFLISKYFTAVNLFFRNFDLHNDNAYDNNIV